MFEPARRARRRSPTATSALALILLSVTITAASSTVASAAPARTNGVDVSHWQGDIDWTRVKRTNVEFAVAKATDGKRFVDPQYLANRVGATANAIAFTAYHFARPNRADDDARIEADHFVDTAGLAPGNLIPALDLEVTNGLNPDEMRRWAWRWLRRVTARTGVRPMIYASPNFWRTAMGDTRFFAVRGYEVLWVAHWFTSDPDVPAGNWAGHGWTFWQWTNCRSVAGISGCVDGDRYDGASLRPVTIPRLRVETSDGGRVVSEPSGIRCGSSCESIFHPGTAVTLVAEPDPGAVFLGWSGTCADAGSTPTCVVRALGNKKATAMFGYPLVVTTPGTGAGVVRSDPAGLTCGATCAVAFPAGTVVTLSATPDARSEFEGWSGDCGGTSICTLTMEGPHEAAAAFGDLAPPQVSFQTPTALGGVVVATFSEPVHGVTTSNLRLRLQGTSRQVASSLACSGPGGRQVPCVAGPVLTARIRPVEPLILGQRYSATANPASAERKIRDRVGKPAPRTTDRFRAATSIGQAGPGVGMSWARVHAAAAYGGSYLVDGRRGASASATFVGRSVTWNTVLGPGMGRARVTIDGMFRGRFDLYAPRLRPRVPRVFSGLSSGSHTLTITVAGSKRSASRGTGVAIDSVSTDRPAASSRLRMRWATGRGAGASGGTFAIAERAGAMAGVTFRGTSVSWTAVLGPNRGRARVYIDGERRALEDLYAPTIVHGTRFTVDGLADRVHTVRIEVAGTKRSTSAGTIVAIDGWSVT